MNIDVGSHWIALFCNGNEIVYFDSFGVEHVPEEIKEFVRKRHKSKLFSSTSKQLVMCRYFCTGFLDFMLAGKKLTDFTNTFSPHDFKKNGNLILSYLKMDESNSIETIDRTHLTEQTKTRLDKISEIENNFHQEISQRKLCSKKYIKYAAAFDYIDKILIFLGATSGGVSIILFMSIVGAPVGIANASFTLIFFLTTGIVKKLLNIRKKNDKA